MTRNVLVIGLGLIGGSIALALQKAPDTRIIGYDMDAQTREHAQALNIVHDTVTDPQAIAGDVDIIIYVNLALRLLVDIQWQVHIKVAY